MDVAEKHLSDGNIQRKVEFKEKIFTDLVEKSNCLLKNLKIKGCISDKNLICFTYEFKRLFGVLGGPVRKKVLEFLDHHIEPIMQTGLSYIRDSEDFLSKIRNVTFIPDGSFLITAEVVGFYPSLPHSAGLKDLKSALENQKEKQLPRSNLIING